LFSDKWRMRSIIAEHRGLTLQPLIADTSQESQ
jgi:hypothetical protein